MNPRSDAAQVDMFVVWLAFLSPFFDFFGFFSFSGFFFFSFSAFFFFSLPDFFLPFWLGCSDSWSVSVSLSASAVSSGLSCRHSAERHLRERPSLGLHGGGYP